MSDGRWTNVKHGTYSGWSTHQKCGERPCDPCYAAKQAYDKRRLEAPAAQRRNRLLARAQSAAKTRLTHNHADEYRALYEAERERLLAEEGPAA